MMVYDKVYRFKVVVEGCERFLPWYFDACLRLGGPNHDVPTVLCSVCSVSRVEGTNDGGSWSDYDPNKTPEQYMRGHIEWIGHTITSIRQLGD